ncbi:hypothetical protein B0H14DRAFT_3866527 [Mycena olivaceomarginata]|nr:hypothetical protein B0H14DRAFT_3866527 [Mycena olivaceomarginata]
MPRRLLEWVRRMHGLYDETRRFLPSRASPCLPAVYIMPSRGIRVPCAGRPVALPLSSPRSHNPTIALTDDALAVVRRGRNGACLGYCPIRVILPDPLLRLPTGDETFLCCGSCSLALKRTSTASTATPRARPQPRATLPSHPPLDVSPGTSLVTQTSPHSGIPTVQLKARFPPRTSADRRVADRGIAICASNAIHRARSPMHLAAGCATATPNPPCPPTFPPVSTYVSPSPAPHGAGHRARRLGTDLSAIPPMHDAAASITVCSRRRPLGRARNRQRPSPRSSTPAPPRSKPHCRWGGQTRAQVRRGTTQRHRGTTYTYVVANMGVAKGSHAARMGAGAIRAKAKDEWGGRFHGRLTDGSTTTPRLRMRMSPPSICLETRTILPPPLVLIHVRAVMSASNDSAT